MAGPETHAAAVASAEDPTMLLYLTVVVGATVAVLVWLFRRGRHEGAGLAGGQGGAEKQTGDKKSTGDNAASKKGMTKGSKKKVSQDWKKVPPPASYTHPELITSLKGHTGNITSGSYSANGKHFISAADDRAVLIWSTKDFGQPAHKSIRGNIEFDYASLVCWSPDTKAFIIHKQAANAIEVYKVSKRPDGSVGNPQVALTFPQHNDIADVIALDIDINGRFIMSCNNKNELIIWNLKGEILQTVDPRHGDTYSAILSPCGRFIATTGFTPDVKVWHVKYSKEGNFEGVKRAFDLSGHNAGIYSCGINSDSTRMVSISKDGTWKLFDTDIEFEKGQQPYLLLTGNYDTKSQPGIIRLSPDGRTIAIACGNNLTFYSGVTGEKLNFIPNIYTGNILGIMFDPSNKMILTLGDRHVRVFHNVAGYVATIQDLKQSLQKATNSSMKDRIKQQIKEAEAALENIKKVTKK
ncbi:transducin beta-like protein 2 isoform X3 [Macrobrachium rosenbergii]|uniref:transducin beta-like protein 2 isoform X3 n=2 Tax=Macrobrachium rosenbergii TaxID=79674 RepID=UPI0034D71C11